MRSQRLSFPNRKGLQLSAVLDLPLGEKPKAFAIFAHCFTCGKNLRAERNISLSMTQHGFAVLRFDFAGIGESEGEFYDTNFSTNVADLWDAASFLEENYAAPTLLIGHSLGGAAVLLASSQMPSVKAVATIGAPSEPEHVKHLFAAIEQRIRTEGKGEILIGGKNVVIKKHFLEDIEGIDLKGIIQNIKKSILVLHSPQDTIVGIDNASEIYHAARHPKSFMTLDGADHLLSTKSDSLYAGNVIASWVKRYINLEESEPLTTDKQAVVRIGSNSYTTEVRAGKHNFLADEPLSVGGDNLGPTPYDLLVASLGTCTAMTMRMYANRKGWPLEEVRVHLEHSKVYDEDQTAADEKGAQIDQIERVIEMEGDLDEKQRARLIEIADRCPVHRTLHNEIRVNTIEKTS
ncbi:MAG: bifunctional alpha/beta hydrolase/OsmC family protein [Bacteroidia bacterium]|nr:bifunctional alpha/beta hydrolase/OsmC family protein [Bacteroidia bacterium]